MSILDHIVHGSVVVYELSIANHQLNVADSQPVVKVANNIEPSERALMP
jgi:hypothetical protein